MTDVKMSGRRYNIQGPEWSHHMVRRALQCWETKSAGMAWSFTSRNEVACSEQRLQSSRQTVELKAGKQSVVITTTAGKSLLEYMV